MRTFGILHIVLFILLMIAYQCTHAQDYVVLTKGDTIHGKLKPLTYGPDKKLQVTEEGKKKVTYPIFQIKSYFYGGETFVPAKGPQGYAFMKVLKSGYLSLLAFQQENQVTFDGRFLLKKNGQGTEVPNLSFKKTLKAFLADCPSVADKIETGLYQKRELELIIDEYNTCVQQGAVTSKPVAVVAAPPVDKSRLSAWDALESKVTAAGDFEGKKDGLEMISEIKGKISRGEKVPNFMIEGLKSTLNREEFQSELQEALKQLN